MMFWIILAVAIANVASAHFGVPDLGVPIMVVGAIAMALVAYSYSGDKRMLSLVCCVLMVAVGKLLITMLMTPAVYAAAPPALVRFVKAITSDGVVVGIAIFAMFYAAVVGIFRPRTR